MFFGPKLTDDVIMENIDEENGNDHTTTDPVSELIDDDTLSYQSPDPEPAFVAPAPAPASMAHAEDRLVRDPHATFGGVLSGFAHRYGFDVALTRLAYIVLTFLLGGITIPLYLLSWIVIPRARYWPPVQRPRTRTLSGRDVGFGLLGAAVFVALAIGTGEAAAIIVPLGLIAAGVWLLIQSPRNEIAVAGAGPAMSAPAPLNVERSTFSDSSTAESQQSWTTPQMPQIAPESVEPRSRKRRVFTFGLIGVFVLIPFLAIAGLIVAIFAGDFDIDFDDSLTVTPIGVDDIPGLIEQDAGEIILDLRNTDLSPLSESDAEPIEVLVQMDAGRIEVLLPADSPVEVSAEVDVVGEVNVFDQTEDGFSPTVSVSDDDPQLILDLEVDLGEIEVTR